MIKREATVTRVARRRARRVLAGVISTFLPARLPRALTTPVAPLRCTRDELGTFPRSLSDGDAAAINPREIGGTGAKKRDEEKGKSVQVGGNIAGPTSTYPETVGRHARVCSSVFATRLSLHTDCRQKRRRARGESRVESRSLSREGHAQGRKGGGAGAGAREKEEKKRASAAPGLTM